MNCVVPGYNVKVLARVIQTLAKLGDELFIDAKEEKLTLITFNQSKTVCGQYDLLDNFFSIYNIKQDQVNDQNSAVSCKIHMKTLLPIFKGTHLEKKLECIQLEHRPPDDTMQFKIKYKCDEIVLSHTLQLMDTEILTIENIPDSGKNNVCAGSDFFNNLLTLFSSTDNEITLEITKTNVVARNYYVGAPHRLKSVRCQVNLNGPEFFIFEIKEETTINFSLKPFRTAVQFAEAFNLNVGLNFDKGGRPLSLVIKNPTFEAAIIVATINPYGDGSSTIATASLPAKITQINAKNLNKDITHEDLEAIANENWDDFDTETENLRKSPYNSRTKPGLSKESKKAISESNVQSWLETKKISSKGPKQFVMEDINTTNDIPNNTKKNGNNSFDQFMDHSDMVPNSPESPLTKKARFIFKRSYDPTCNASVLGAVLAGDSDSE